MSFLQLRHFNRDIPLSKAQRRTIYRHARKLWWKGRRNVVCYFGAYGVGLVVPNLFMYFLEPHLATVPRWLGYPGVIGIFLIYAATGVVMVERYFYGPCVRRAMRELAFDVCLKCGYWLRGLDDSVERCPECGTLREPVPETEQE